MKSAAITVLMKNLRKEKFLGEKMKYHIQIPFRINLCDVCYINVMIYLGGAAFYTTGKDWNAAYDNCFISAEDMDWYWTT